MKLISWSLLLILGMLVVGALAGIRRKDSSRTPQLRRVPPHKREHQRKYHDQVVRPKPQKRLRPIIIQRRRSRLSKRSFDVLSNEWGSRRQISSKESELPVAMMTNVKVEQPEQGFGGALASFFYEVGNLLSSLTNTKARRPQFSELDIEFIDHYNADPSWLVTPQN